MYVSVKRTVFDLTEPSSTTPQWGRIIGLRGFGGAVEAPPLAWQELENLPSEKRATAEALVLRVRIFFALRRYGHAAMLAQQFVEAAPERADLHFLAARALARLGQIEKVN